MPAQAHEWYSAQCCSGTDCAPVRVRNVEITPNGYFVTLEPGDHPLVIRRTTAFLPFNSPRIQQSQDYDYHVCASATRQASEPGTSGQHLFCLYIPLLGS
jgi:hypothetical protein